MWVASTNGYTIYRRNAAGDTVMQISVDAERGSLSAEQEDTIRAVIDRFDSPVAPPVDRASVGVGWQFIRSLHPDDEGRLFMRPTIQSFEEQDRVFDVFDAEGRYLGRMQSDVELRNRPPPVIKDGHRYGVGYDDLGVPVLIRGEIVMPGGS